MAFAHGGEVFAAAHQAFELANQCANQSIQQSIAQASHIIGVPESTVKTRMFYARKRLAELMSERGMERT